MEKTNSGEIPLFSFDGELRRLAIKYGQDEGLARRIIKCESFTYAYATGTKAVVGKDIGYFQINSFYHENRARSLGFNIYDWRDNLEYGFWLLSENGTSPWKASQKCWL